MKRIDARRHGKSAVVKAATRPTTGSLIVQQTVNNPTTWNVASVLNAIREHEEGDFSSTGLLAEAMGRDDRISGCLRTRCNALAGKNGLDFDILPADDGPEELADRVKAWWDKVLPDDTIRSITEDLVMIGVHVSRIEWTRTDREWVPTALERWHPTNYYWDESAKAFYLNTVTGPEPIDPNDPNWLVITHSGSRSWLAGAVRALGLAFVMRQFNWRDWAKFNERHGLPIIAIKEPGALDVEDKEKFFKQLKRLGTTGIIRLPQTADGQGFELEVVEAKDRAHETFTAFRKDLDISIAVTILGQNLTSEATGGSLALGRVHDRIRQDFLEADAELLSNALREQLIVPYGRYNVAGFTDDAAPWPTWQTGVPTDRKEEGEALSKVAEALSTLLQTKLPLDYEVILERVGLPVKAGANLDPEALRTEQPDPNTQNAPTNGKQAPKPQTTSRARAHARGPIRLASGAKVDPKSGFVQGQLYTDDLVDNGTKAAGGALKPFLAELLDIVEAGTDYDQIREAITAKYRELLTPSEMRSTLEKALVLAELAGSLSVTQDL